MFWAPSTVPPLEWPMAVEPEPVELWRRIASNEAPDLAEVAAEGSRLLVALQDAVAAGKAKVAKVAGKWRKMVVFGDFHKFLCHMKHKKSQKKT